MRSVVVHRSEMPISKVVFRNSLLLKVTIFITKILSYLGADFTIELPEKGRYGRKNCKCTMR